MLLVRQNLRSMPALFSERPWLLNEVLALRLRRTVPPSDVFSWRKVQTRCSCSGGSFYYEEHFLAGNKFEVYACGVCKTWGVALLH